MLGVLFVALKLCGVIGWSWWWVTAPFWGGLAICFGLFAVVSLGALAILAGIGAALGLKKLKKK